VRIAVIGTGAIGGTVAALLHRAGNDVAVTARGAGLAAIAEHGIRLDGAWGEHVAAVTASDRLSGTPELAFVCTKAQDAEAAMGENAAALRGIPVVVVQNGLEGLEAAGRVLPDSDCVGALALYAAQYVEPGRVTVTATGATYLGSGPGEPSPVARRAAATLDAAMPAHATENFIGCQWTKLVINMVNAVPAATGLSVQQTIRDRLLGRVVTAAMRETVRVGRAAGIHYGSLQGLSQPALLAFASAPLWAGRVLPLAMARRMGATPNLGSTLQSIRRGQATEIDYLNGAVVSAAAAIGRTAPVNAALVAAVHQVERAGSFIDPRELAVMVARQG
jgi:2-dehydropantoate 2-reductase